MRLLFGRSVPTQGRQPEILTAPAVHLPTLSVSQKDHLDGATRVFLGLRLVPLATSASQFLAMGRSLRRQGAAASRSGAAPIRGIRESCRKEGSLCDP